MSSARAADSDIRAAPPSAHARTKALNAFIDSLPGYGPTRDASGSSIVMTLRQSKTMSQPAMAPAFGWRIRPPAPSSSGNAASLGKPRSVAPGDATMRNLLSIDLVEATLD